MVNEHRRKRKSRHKGIVSRPVNSARFLDYGRLAATVHVDSVFFGGGFRFASNIRLFTFPTGSALLQDEIYIMRVRTRLATFAVAVVGVGITDVWGVVPGEIWNGAVAEFHEIAAFWIGGEGDTNVGTIIQKLLLVFWLSVKRKVQILSTAKKLSQIYSFFLQLKCM